MSKTVLIADDSMFSRNLIKNVVRDNGFEVIAEASNGRSAVTSYQEKATDIVILDLTMPLLNGLEALQEIIDYDPKAKVIMYSAMGQQRLIIEALKIGAKDFVIKPNINKLLPAMKKIFW
ncbi:response regulator [Robertmurraya sp. DFI.2.37]|uniref:response regulator n=1 Tax=Robertmurraya sp. DFI.2.37 TaxID=3031819 RepID=UPI0023DC2954|nr:response regulator [Robertmurraya sp. DFI.2.37]MDF1510051.1 response regulator [Robertmurraya sp. DFI.2.37]